MTLKARGTSVTRRHAVLFIGSFGPAMAMGDSSKKSHPRGVQIAADFWMRDGAVLLMVMAVMKVKGAEEVETRGE